MERILKALLPRFNVNSKEGGLRCNKLAMQVQQQADKSKGSKDKDIRNAAMLMPNPQECK